jgi:hypothetical protein
MVLGDQRLDEALAVLLESLDRSRLVALHQARVADDIGREDGSEASVGTGGGHNVASERLTSSICGSGLEDRQA